MSDLGPALRDLAAWYPAVQALCAQPDTSAVTGRLQPATRFPGNSAAFALWWRIHTFSRRAENAARRAVTGTASLRGGSDANTAAALDAAARLAEAIPVRHDEPGKDAGGKPRPCGCPHCRLRRCAEGLVSQAQQLPAVDLEQPWRKVPGPCPRCTRPMLRYQQGDRYTQGRVACLGCRAHGQLMPGTVSDGYVAWDDGTVT